jgi:hypothetical protein
VFENRVLTRTFVPKRDEIMGGWRKLHNEEFHNSFSSPNILRTMKIKRMIRTGRVTLMQENGNAYIFKVKEPEGNTPLGRA